MRGQSLVLTTTDAWTMVFIGQPYVYKIDRVSDACGLLAPLAIQVVEGCAAWMGQSNFHRFDGGSVRIIPCDVSDYVFNDLNYAQAAKISSGHLSAFGEVWWFYPSADSLFNNRYVVWNYRENHWSIGTMARGCWADAGVFLSPLAVGESGLIYQHETGYTDDGTAILTDRFATSGPVEFGSGDRIMEALQLIPDERTSGQVQFRFATQFTPEGPVFDHGPYSAAPYTDTRFAGRQVAMKVESVVDADYRVGLLRLDAKPGGLR